MYDVGSEMYHVRITTSESVNLVTTINLTNHAARHTGTCENVSDAPRALIQKSRDLKRVAKLRLGVDCV